MFARGQTHGMHHNDKAISQQRPRQPDSEYLDILAQQQPPLATVIQRARLDPVSLSPRNVPQLQRTIGNRTVRQLLARTAQRQLANTGDEPATSRLSAQESFQRPVDRLGLAVQPCVQPTRVPLRFTRAADACRSVTPGVMNSRDSLVQK